MAKAETVNLRKKNKTKRAKAAPKKENQMTIDLDIPELDIEDDPELNEEEESVEDKSGGALVYTIVGAGQGGGRMAKAFYDMGYTKTVAVNTAKSDLNGLDLPENQKFLVDEHGEQGAGKDQAKAEAAIERKEQEVFNKFREIREQR